MCACKLSEEEKFGIVQALMKNKRAFELDMLELDEYE
jgi:hypothetical protein